MLAKNELEASREALVQGFVIRCACIAQYLPSIHSTVRLPSRLTHSAKYSRPRDALGKQTPERHVPVAAQRLRHPQPTLQPRFPHLYTPRHYNCRAPAHCWVHAHHRMLPLRRDVTVMQLRACAPERRSSPHREPSLDLPQRLTPINVLCSTRGEPPPTALRVCIHAASLQSCMHEAAAVRNAVPRWVVFEPVEQRAVHCEPREHSRCMMWQHCTPRGS